MNQQQTNTKTQESTQGVSIQPGTELSKPLSNTLNQMRNTEMLYYTARPRCGY